MPAAGVAWAIDNVLDAWEKLAPLPRAAASRAGVDHSRLRHVAAGYQRLAPFAAVVVDPPYDDNVQYSELADFFYVWLKRTQGHRHPDWFATYLCDHDEEAVVNISRFRTDGTSTRRCARGGPQVTIAS